MKEAKFMLNKKKDEIKIFINYEYTRSFKLEIIVPEDFIDKMTTTPGEFAFEIVKNSVKCTFLPDSQAREIQIKKSS